MFDLVGAAKDKNYRAFSLKEVNDFLHAHHTHHATQTAILSCAFTKLATNPI